MQFSIACQGSGEKSDLREHLESVADPQNRSPSLGKPINLLENRSKAG
jgi:hypothetical protein